MKKWIGLLAFVLLLTYWTLGTKPWVVFAAADAGYTKVGTVSAPTLTFIDSTVADGTTYQWEVTAANSAGESAADLPTAATTIPATGSHTATISWGASTGGGAPSTYNIYRTTVTAPNPPGAASVTVN